MKKQKIVATCRAGLDYARAVHATRRTTMAAALCVVMGSVFPGVAPRAAESSGAGTYPDRPIRLVVAYGPGGVADLVGRVLATAMSKALGQTVFVDNRGGGGGTIGAGTVAAAAPDGYTLLLTSPPMVAVAPLIVGGLKYNAVEDFTTIGTAVVTPNILVVNPSLPIRSMADLASFSHAAGKGTLSYASSGPGSVVHLLGHILTKAMNAEMVHIPYASGNVFPDVIAGRVSMAFDSVPSTIGYIQSNRVRAIAVLSEKRSTLLPDVPTVAEAGFPAAKITFWMGVEGPAKLPAPIVNKLNAAIHDAVNSAAMREQLVTLGAEPFLGSPQDFDTMRRRDIGTLQRLAREMGLRHD